MAIAQKEMDATTIRLGAKTLEIVKKQGPLPQNGLLLEGISEVMERSRMLEFSLGET